MSAVPAPQGDLLNRILALTPAGQRELRDPRAGLSLPQRWLLVQVDGESSLADIAEKTAGTAQVDRLPRDAAKLVSLGMAYDVGEPGPSEFGPSSQQADFAATVMSPPISSAMGRPSGAFGTPRSRLPMLAIGGALALAGVGAGYLLWSPSSASRPAPAAASAAAPSTPPAAVSSVQAAAASVAQLLATPSPGAPVTTGAPPPLPTVPGTAGPGAQPLPVGAAPVTSPLPTRAASGSRFGGAGAAAASVAPYTTSAAPAPARRLDEPSARPGADAAPTVSVPPLAAAPSPAPAPLPAPVPAAGSAPAPPAAAAAPATTPAPAPANPATVAYSAPSSPPAAAPVAATAAPLRPLSNPAPAFPREGVADGRREVMLKARLVIGASGEVTRVEFSESSPRDRAFERSARSTLLQWRFPEGSGDRSYRTDLVFRLD